MRIAMMALACVLWLLDRRPNHKETYKMYLSWCQEVEHLFEQPYILPQIFYPLWKDAQALMRAHLEDDVLEELDDSGGLKGRFLKDYTRMKEVHTLKQMVQQERLKYT